MILRARQTVGRGPDIVGTRAELQAAGVWIGGPEWTAALRELQAGRVPFRQALGPYGRCWSITLERSA